jgi:membrane-bound lytic murein transglycosylase D
MKKLLALVVTLFLIQFSKADTPIISGHQHHDGTGMGKGLHDTVGQVPARPALSRIYSNNIYTKRLDSIQKDVQLDYNEYVQEYIDNYLSTSREEIGREIGLAKYYFPIYEKAFRDAGIPDEIKYLSIVESQLNPNAVSRVGATGPWQFMTPTAKLYGLRIDSYVDERRDPVKSSYAAAAYLKDAYQQFGDWLLAIASYNCGKSNVVEAIQKAGASDYWSVRQYLPAETRGYVPAYIAITYIMNYYKKYNIVPQQCSMTMKTDTVLVNKVISLNSVSHALGINLYQLSVLNPSYTQMIVNGSADAPKMLVIPEKDKEKYKALYNSLNSDMSNIEIPGYDSGDNAQQVEKRIPLHHRSRKFDRLASVGKMNELNKG